MRKSPFLGTNNIETDAKRLKVLLQRAAPGPSIQFSSNPGAESFPLKTDVDGFLQLDGLYILGRTVGGDGNPIYAFEVWDDAGNDYLALDHDGTDAHFRTDDGAFTFTTDEGTNTNTQLIVKGKGTGFGNIIINDEDNAEYLSLYTTTGVGHILTAGSSPSVLALQYTANANIYCFHGATEGETRELQIYGFRAGDALRSLQIGVGVDAADTASFDGLTNYYFYGDGSNYLALRHDGTDAHFRTDDGSFVFTTDEGTNTNTAVYIQGKGTGYGQLLIRDEDSAEHLHLYSSGGKGYIETAGSSPDVLRLQSPAHADVYVFPGATEGLTPELRIYGYRAGDASRSLQIGVGVDAASTASFDGVGNYWFDGRIIAVDGIVTEQSVANVSDPPTSAELDAAFGAAGGLNRGYIVTVDDNDGDTDCWLCWTSDASWYYVQGTKAT